MLLLYCVMSFMTGSSSTSKRREKDISPIQFNATTSDGNNSVTKDLI